MTVRALPESRMLNVGIDQTVGRSFRMNATYTYRRGVGLLRGRNLNAPVAGVRPDPRFANVIDVVGDAASRSHALNLGASLVMLNWHADVFAANWRGSDRRAPTRRAPFAAGQRRRPVDGMGTGRAAPSRAGGSFNTQPIRNLTVNVNVRALSGAPYNITTGVDGNGDGVFGDRPAGVGRNTARAAAQWDLGMRVSYAIGIGKRAPSGGGGPQAVMISMGGGGVQSGFSGGANDARYRIGAHASSQNITNHRNLTGYSGVLTSPSLRDTDDSVEPAEGRSRSAVWF
jgi:hypothetical protein